MLKHLIQQQRKRKPTQRQNIFHVIVNANAIVQQERNNKTCRACQFECKNYCKRKKDYSWNPNTRIQENSKYLKSVADISVTECDEIIIALDNLAKTTTKKNKYYVNKIDKYYNNKNDKYYNKKRTNILAINVASTTSINYPI